MSCRGHPSAPRNAQLLQCQQQGHVWSLPTASDMGKMASVEVPNVCIVHRQWGGQMVSCHDGIFTLSLPHPILSLLCTENALFNAWSHVCPSLSCREWQPPPPPLIVHSNNCMSLPYCDSPTCRLLKVSQILMKFMFLNSGCTVLFVGSEGRFEEPYLDFNVTMELLY